MGPEARYRHPPALALWSDFSGTDPESVAGGLPQTRSWSLRMDLGL